MNAQSFSKPIHVLGIGSPFGADSFGWDMIDELKKHDTDLVLHKLLNPITEIMPAIAGAGSVIVVDALVGGEEGVTFFDHYSNWLPKDNKNSSHGIGIIEALQLANQLGELAEGCYVYATYVGDQANIQQHVDKVLHFTGLFGKLIAI